MNNPVQYVSNDSFCLGFNFFDTYIVMYITIPQVCKRNRLMYREGRFQILFPLKLFFTARVTKYILFISLERNVFKNTK